MRTNTVLLFLPIFCVLANAQDVQSPPVGELPPLADLPIKPPEQAPVIDPRPIPAQPTPTAPTTPPAPVTPKAPSGFRVVSSSEAFYLAPKEESPTEVETTTTTTQQTVQNSWTPTDSPSYPISSSEENNYNQHVSHYQQSNTSIGHSKNPIEPSSSKSPIAIEPVVLPKQKKTKLKWGSLFSYTKKSNYRARGRLDSKSLLQYARSKKTTN